jgi:hypothetical protein
MLTYKKLQEELGGKEKSDKSVSLKSKVIAFGRMNPPTAGHEQVVNKVRSVAKEHGADHAVILSGSHDTTPQEKKKAKNPLSPEQKVTHATNAFPGTNVTAAKRGETILHHAAAAHAAGVNHLHVVAGSDRQQATHDLLHKYNGQHGAHGHYNFKSITMHSSGERDPDSEGTSGISGSKMREHAASGNKEAFHAGAPSGMKPKHKDAMYNDVRKSMNLKEETVQETLRPEMGASHYIDDFIKSTNPRFNNKSKEERRKMAIGAYMAAKARGVKEEVQIDELSTDLLGRYKTASAASAKAADASGNYAKGDKRFKGINKATSKQFDNDLKKHVQMKEGTMQPNGTDQIETSTSAPSASTAKDTSMGKKIKGFKFFTGENDKQMNMNQPVKEAKDSHEYGYEGEMAMNQLKTLVRCAEMIEDCLKPDTDLPEWVQSKITLATDYIQTAADYLYSESEVKEGYSSYSGRSHGHAYGGGGFGKREREDDEYHVPDPTPVAPTPARKYIKDTSENKAAKAARKPINGHPTNEEVIDERNKENALMRKTMDASRGAKFKLKNPVPDADPKHKTARDHNVAIGRALRSEAVTAKAVNVDAVNTAGQEPHEEKFETVKKSVSKLKKVKEESMKSYKEFLQSLEEKLIGKQKKLDKNHNGELDKQDFELLRKEELERIEEIKMSEVPSRMIKGKSYGADYEDPEGAFETKKDMKKPEKAGRKAGQSTGSYKPRATMSKLKSAGATYK